MKIVDQPFFVPRSDDEALFAIASQPESPGPCGVMLLPPGGYNCTAQGNRWAVTLAHRLASFGHRTVRFDWPGIGDSTGVVETFALHEPATADAEAVLSVLETDRRILVGQCYGARAALALAPNVDRLAGVAMLAPPVRDFERGDGTATRQAYELSIFLAFELSDPHEGSLPRSFALR